VGIATIAKLTANVTTQLTKTFALLPVIATTPSNWVFDLYQKILKQTLCQPDFFPL
jgi:hypothetical protein